jgi:hypothetical protein
VLSEPLTIQTLLRICSKFSGLVVAVLYSINSGIRTMEDNSAAAMIRRFREGKPTSREDREKKKQVSGVDKLWYENDGEKPRSLSVEPSLPPARPSPALRGVRQPADYMTESTSSLFRGSKLGDMFGVDDLIEKEIRQLEQQMGEMDRRTNARMDLGSFQPTRSLDLRGSLGGMRDSTEGFRLAGRNLRGSVSPMRLSGDLLRSSVETLGSTGFRGLLAAHLKLDGKKEDEKPKEEVKSAAEMAELNKNLEAFLQSMKEQHPPKNTYFPEGVDESIAQVANKVHSDMLDFQHLFGDKHSREDAEAKAQKQRDEAMREEGRKEAREKQLLELDLPATHPLEYFGVWEGQQQYPGVVASSAVPYLQPHAQNAAGYSHAPAPTSGGVTDFGVHLETDLSGLRTSDDSSLGSPFPQYKSTVLSPQASSSGALLPTIKEDTIAEEKGSVPMSMPKADSASTSAAAAAPTLKEAGIVGTPSTPATKGSEAAAAADVKQPAPSAAEGQTATRRALPAQMVAGQLGAPAVQRSFDAGMGE